ncbi:hypothetical protein AYL99_03124 [Fonsecaea erecta]|uniref:ABM domain-containing protein n=1 Tax=Fonsecaea erecta TaxID=1367422 RepID=A0A178ZW02_9EURO|nr:hypothetical protein AYL99_03124 [Fonsecaea erecta]OAP63897.1 hypothetical protein AYL99_03124 [Fonsecaea erecta]
MAITEIALLPLRHGENPEETTSRAATVHAEALDVVLSQPGARRVCWGRQVEDPSVLTWFVDWDELEDHQKFMDSDAYNPFLERFGSILGAGAKAYHVRFLPEITTATIDPFSTNTAPATEIVTMWLPRLYSEADQARLVENVKAFLAVLEREAKGYKSWVGGWVEEEEGIDIPGTDGKGKAYVLVVGWESVEAHKEFCETRAFKENISLVLGVKDLKKIEAVHASLIEVRKRPDTGS